MSDRLTSGLGPPGPMTPPSAPADASITPRVRYGGVTRSVAVFVMIVIGAGVVAAALGTTVADSPPIPGLSVGPPVRYGIPFARFVLDVAVTAVVGLALVPKLLGFDRPDRTEPVIAPARVAALWASVVWVVAALGSIVLLTIEMSPGEIVTPAAIGRYIAAIPAGKGLLITAACGAVSWWLAKLSLRHGEKVPAELRVGVALFGLLPLPLTGHASNWRYHDLSMAAMELHIVGSAAWTGGLVALIVLLARHRDLLAVALPKFSRLATWCVFVVGLSGVAVALLELYLSPITALPESLWGTRYGVLVLAKAGCLALVAAIAIHVRRRVMPAAAAGRRSAFAMWCAWEVTVLSVAFAVAVVLTRAQVTPL